MVVKYAFKVKGLLISKWSKKILQMLLKLLHYLYYIH